MTKREALRRQHQFNTLKSLGISDQDVEALRRISMQLHTWHERECGIDNGCIERDETTNKPYWLNSITMKRWPIPDREAGAKKRLAKVMAKYDGLCRRPHLATYIQTDPRGAALYILRPGDIPTGQDVDAYYSRGICVY